jgi:hypothetical protein
MKELRYVHERKNNVENSRVDILPKLACTNSKLFSHVCLMKSLKSWKLGKLREGATLSYLDCFMRGKRWKIQIGRQTVRQTDKKDSFVV